MKLINVIVVGALLLFAAAQAHADDISGGDSRIVIGTQPGGSPSCTSFQATADGTGAISGDCINDGSAPITTLTFAAPVSGVLGGSLTCDSILSNLNWSLSQSTIDNGTVDECTFTAPTEPTNLRQLGEYLATQGGFDAYLYAATHDPGVKFDLFNPLGNDGDCDADDLMFGIPVGCDVTFGTPSSITDPTELFVEDTQFDISPTGVGGLAPFTTPEPGTLAMLLLGLAPLGFLHRRRAAQR